VTPYRSAEEDKEEEIKETPQALPTAEKALEKPSSE
jgi:hypothetical protein